ncbi:MAG TPA: biotin/lipoyl-containing protein [Conexibacter sp.]|nr:biotin/lipoyl-containing protein [Conexibacter sp.]
MAIEVVVPEPGDHEEFDVVEIMVEVGEQVEAGDALVEIATDKANMDVEAPAAGTVVEVRVSEGDTVPVTTVLMVIEP